VNSFIFVLQTSSPEPFRILLHETLRRLIDLLTLSASGNEGASA
jgi:hypothetical protein